MKDVQFEPISIFPTGVRLRCRRDCTLGGEVSVLVQGIVVGEKHISTSFAAGDQLALPVNYFPLVHLPAEMRFVIGEDEICTPLEIKSADDVMTIVGPGEITVRNLMLENGLLRGALINKTNCIHLPNLHIRLNGFAVRSVVVERPRGLDEGGAVSMFAVPIRLTDFVESGLSIDIHLAGIEHPISHFSFVRGDLTADVERLINVEAQLRDLQKSFALESAMAVDRFNRRLNVQQERVDAFIEYVISIVFDATASGRIAIEPTSFSRALREAGKPKHDLATSSSVASAEASWSIIPLDAPEFAFGWYNVEIERNGNFRWMGKSALIRNPLVGRPVSKIELRVMHVYGTQEPMITAAFDDQNLKISLSRKDGVFVLVLESSLGSQPIFGKALYLESATAGCPANDTGSNDERTLALAVSEVRFFYQDETIAA